MPAKSESSRPDTMATLAENVVASNPKLAARMERLLDQMIASAEHVMKWGTEDQRAGLMKMMVPHMLRGMNNAAARNNNADEEAEFEAMRRAMGGGASS